MPVGLDYEINGIAEVEHDLLGFAARSMVPEPALRLVASAIRSIEQELFASEGKGNWPPLAASTVAKKGHNRILVETEALKDSLTEQGDGAHFEIFQRNELIYGSSDPKAALHKAGTSKMPKRDPLIVDASDVKAFSKAIQAYLMGVERTEFGLQSFGLGLTEPFGV